MISPGCGFVTFDASAPVTTISVTFQAPSIGFFAELCADTTVVHSTSSVKPFSIRTMFHLLKFSSALDSVQLTLCKRLLGQARCVGWPGAGRGLPQYPEHLA